MLSLEKDRFSETEWEAIAGGKLSTLKWMRLKPPYDCSRSGLFSLIWDRYKSVHSAWIQEKQGEFGLHLKFKWWTWFLPFYRVSKTIDLTLKIKEICPAGVVFQGVTFDRLFKKWQC